MGYVKYSRCASVLVVLMSCGLLACGGGGSGSKTSATSSTTTLSSTAPVLSSVAPASSSSSTPAPNPALVTSLTLGAPTTNPIVIPPSATAVPVKFLSVVRGNYYPEQLLLDEVDKAGAVVRPGVAVLKDDGTQGDAFRGDQIYTGQLLLGSVASLEKSYRVHADHKGKDVTSGIGRFWVSGCPSVARPSNPDKAVLDISSNTYVFADEVLVTLADTVAPELSEINALMAEAKGQVVGCIPALNQYLVELSDSSTVASLYAAIATLKSKAPQVLDASPNAVVLSPPSENTSACDGQECQWYLERIRAPEAWALVGGGDQQMGVGVIDFGVDCTHADINCNGSANSEDKIDHGTGVASLIAAHKGDGTAMVGVAWNTALYPFSFIGRGGSQYKMSELITLSMAEESIRVINISAATATDPSNQIRDAMCSAIDSGRLIVAAAGNASTANSCQLEKVYPARYNTTGTCANGANLAKGLLVVGAIDANNNLAQWENNSLCSNTFHVDVFAPGKDIYAASANNNGYAAKNGTSFSSPLVAGSAAVLWAAEPTLTVAQVHDKLVTSSVTYAKGSTVSDTSRNHTQDPRLEGKQLLDLFAAVGGRDTPLALDLIPDAFAFAERTNAELNTYISSERITIKGIDATVPIAIEGGFYAIDNAPFTSAAGTVGPNQTLVVQLLSANSPLMSRELTLTVAGIKQSFRVTTAAMVAAQPSSFNFTDLVNAELGARVLSGSLTIAGLTEATPIAIVGGEYAIDGGAFTSANGTVAANQPIQLRVTASTLPDTAVVATVTIGAVSDTFRVTTLPADITPEPFAFADSNNVAPDSVLTSNSITIKGINTAANISVSGGEYAIDGGSYRSASGKVQAGQTVTLRHKSAAQFAADSYTALTIGGYTATFHSRTSNNTAPTATNIAIQDINGGNVEVGDSLLGTYTYMDADNDPEGASHYRWLRNGVVIANQTTTTYVLTAADSGQDIRFEVTPVAVAGVTAGSVKESPANPVVNSAPRVSDLLITPTSGVVGDILRASYSYQDAEGDQEGQSTYRWLRNGVAIAGATGATYQTGSNDVGQPLSVEITPVALSGKLSGVAVISNALLLGNTAPLGKSAAITGAVAGKAAVGATLSGTYVFSDVDGDLEGASGYRWLRNGVAIAGATSRNYLVTAADSGQLIVVEVTPVAATGTVQGAVVLSSAVSVNTVPSAQAVKVIDNNGGSLLVGDTLTGSYTYADAESDAQGSSRFRWLRNGVAISGATSISYVLTSVDSAQNILFEVTPMAVEGSLAGVAVQSVAVSVGNSAPVATNVAIIDSNGGSPMLGDTLSGTYSYSDSDGNSQGATTFSWLRDGSPVSSSPSYTLSAADSGKTLQFKVTPRAISGVVQGAEAASALLTVPLFVPNTVSFNAITGAALNSVVTSNPVTISGINTAVPISISNGQYAINGGAFTSAPGVISNGQTLVLRVTSAPAMGSSVQAVVMLGGATSNFSVTTVVADTTPDAFSFPQVGNAAVGSVVTSAVVTVSGINTAAPISIVGGEYSINGGAFISSAGVVSNGQTLRVRVTAASVLSSTVQAVLTIGAVSATFSVSTSTSDTSPDAFAFVSINNAEFNSAKTSNTVTISGINTAAPISISNGQYSINGAAFTSAAGTIANGQTITVKVTASANPSTIVLATVNVGGVTGTFAVSTVAADIAPDTFSFAPVTNAALSSAVTSNTIIITGINTAAPISIINGHYSINGGAYINTPGTISAGQTLSIRVVASATLGATQQATLTIGGIVGTFSVTTQAADTTPDAFSFPQVRYANLGSVVTSAPVTITGINAAAPISVVGGEYSINGGAFVSTAGTVSNGQTLSVRVTAPSVLNTTVQVVVVLGGVSGTFSVSTMMDVTPDAYTFPPLTNVAVGAVVSAPPVTITGINTAAPISILGGEYSINGGAFVSTPGTVSSGQAVTVRLTASTTPSVSVQAVLTVGDLSRGFLVTTEVADTTPDAFSFPQVGNAGVGSLVVSAPITLSGINTAASISVIGGSYSINGGSFTASPGVVGNGSSLRVRLVAATAFSTTTQAVLTVGGVAGTFSVSTAILDTTPDAFSFLPVSNAELNSAVTSNSIAISGINSAAPVSVANGQYSINGGAYTSAAGTISNGQTITVKTTASASPDTITLATLSVGGVMGKFSVATIAADSTPNAFSFAPVGNVALSVPVVSNVITISGINLAVPVSIVGGEYAINGGAFTNLAGVVSSGQTISIRAVASANPSTSTQAFITVGTASAAFVVTTKAVSAPPAVAVLFPALSSLTEKSTIVVRGTASDGDGISSVDVNGILAAYNQATLSWQATVPLAAGVNNLIVTATDTQNNKSTSSVNVRRNSLGDGLLKVRADAVHNRWVAFINDAPVNGQVVSLLGTIDRTSGELNVVPGDALRAPRDLQISADGTRALVLEAPFNIEVIKEINLQTGVRKIIYQDTAAGSVATDFGNQAPLLGASSMVWLENEKRVLVLERDSKSIRSINTDTAVRTMLSAPLLPSSENALKAPIDMLLSPVTGNIMVLDDRIPAVISVNPVSGARSLYKNLAVANRVPQFTSMAFNSGDGSFLISSAGWGLTRVRSDLVYEDLQFRMLQQVLAGTDANNAILLDTELESINLTTKATTLLLVAPTGSGELPLSRSMDVALDTSANFAYVVDIKANAIFKVSLANGKRTLFASNAIATGSSNINFQSLTGIDIDLPRNRLLVNDISQNAIIAVDLSTASRTLVSRDTAAAAINNLSLITNKLAVDSAGRFVYSINGASQIVRVDTVTAERRVLSDNTIELARSTISFDNLWDLVVDDARNRLLVADERAGEIIAVDLTSGVRSKLTPVADGVRKFPGCIAIDNLSKQAITLSESPVSIYASHLETGVKRDIDTSKDTLMTSFAVTGMAYNPTKNTVIVAEGGRKAIIEVDLATGDSVVLSQ